MPQHEERTQGSILVNGPVDFDKGNYCKTRGDGRVPKASVGSVHLSPYLTLAIQFCTQFLHWHFCKITWLSSTQMMEINARKRVLNFRTGWRLVASVTPRPLYTRCKSPCYRVVPQGWPDSWQHNSRLSAVRTNSVHWPTSLAELPQLALVSQPTGTVLCKTWR
jgi:hypothetical protein